MNAISITLVALAALAATAAFADVTVTGAFDPTAIHTTTSYADHSTASQTNMTYNGRSTSRIQFDVTEDLGGGMQAIARMENDFQPQNAEDGYGKGADQGQPSAGINFGTGGGEIYTGLTGGFGAVKLGAPNTPTLYVQAGGIFGTKLGSGFSEGIGGTGHVRQSQTVNYTTPSFNGLTVSWGHTFGQNADADVYASASAATAAVAGVKNAGSIDDIGVMYANGALSGGVSYFKKSGVSAGAAGTALDNTLLSYIASYTMGNAMFQVGGHTETNAVYANSTTANTYTAVQGNNNGSFVAAKYAMGATTLLAQFSNLSDQSSLANNKHMTALGLDYALSKNTTLYARYSNMTVDNASAYVLSTASTAPTIQQISKQTKTAAGIQINF